MSFVAIVIFTMQKSGIYLPEILNNYANDLLCLPLVLGFILFMIKRLKKDKNFELPLIFVLILAVYYSVYFEYYLSKVNPRYTSDWIDVLLYFVGAIGFYSYQKMTAFRRMKYQLRSFVFPEIHKNLKLLDYYKTIFRVFILHRLLFLRVQILELQ